MDDDLDLLQVARNFIETSRWLLNSCTPGRTLLAS